MLDATIRTLVRDAFGLTLGDLEVAAAGTDRAARLWRAVATDGAPYAVKLTSGGSAAGLTVPAALARHGVPGLAAPVAAVDGASWVDVGRDRLVVMPWVPGTSALRGGMTPAHWGAFGRLLAAVHAVPPGGVALDLPHEEHRPDAWRGAAERLGAALRRRGDEPVAREVRRLWDDGAAHVVDRLLAAVEALGERLRRRDHPVVVCHGDPHLGNVLVAPDDVWLVDWDDAVLAPRERDLALALSAVLSAAPVTAEQQEWFLDGYGPVEIDGDRCAYYRCVRGLEDVVGWALDAVDVEGRDEQERREALHILRGVLSPGGLARQALGSAEVSLGRPGSRRRAPGRSSAARTRRQVPP